MKKPQQILRIGLFGPYGSGNLGDAAIQDAVIQNISKFCPDAAIYGFSGNPEDTERRHKIPSFSIKRRYNPSLAPQSGHQSGMSREQGGRVKGALKRIRLIYLPLRFVKRTLELAWTIYQEFLFALKCYKILKGLDMLIISGGGQLSDTWGGPWAHPYRLLLWAILAKASRTRYIVVSVGAGPLNYKLSRFFIKWSLRLADYTSYRNDYSKRLIEDIGVNGENPVYPDLAYSLAVNPHRKSASHNETNQIVGISPIAYYAWPQQDQLSYEAYIRKLAAIVSWLNERQYDVLLSHSNIRMDIPAIKDLKTLLANNGSSKARGKVIEPSVLSVDDLMHQISTVEMVIASRLHSILLSTLLLKPVIAISPAKKVDTLMSDIGLSEYCLDINQFDLNPFIKRFMALESSRDNTIIELAQLTSEYKDALEVQYQRIFTH